MEKVQVFETRYDELAQRLCDPSVMMSPDLYAQVMKEYKSVEPLALVYKQYCRASREKSEAEELLEENSSDSEMCAMLREELDVLDAQLLHLTEEMKILLLPKDPNDDRNVIVEIRGGAGGEEAALFAAVLYRMKRNWVDSRRSTS